MYCTIKQFPLPNTYAVWISVIYFLCMRNWKIHIVCFDGLVNFDHLLSRKLCLMWTINSASVILLFDILKNWLLLWLQLSSYTFYQKRSWNEMLHYFFHSSTSVNEWHVNDSRGVKKHDWDIIPAVKEIKCARRFL